MAKREFNETAIKVAVARGCGHTVERTAEIVGCSVSTVYNHLDAQLTKQLEAFTKTAVGANISEAVTASTEAFKREWERRRETAMDVHDTLMRSVGTNPALALKAAENVFDRADGKPTQTVKSDVSQEVRVTYTIDKQLLDAWQAEARALLPATNLISGPAEILDAELVP